MSSDDELLLKARVASQIELTDELLKVVVELVDSDTTFTEETRDFLLSAFKQKIVPLRHAWRILDGIISDPGNSNERQLKLSKLYIKYFENKIAKCVDELMKVTGKLLEKTEDYDHKVFLLKMKGDFLRYQAECSSNDDSKDKAAKESHAAYEEAEKIGLANLSASSQTMLALYLNYAVFHLEIMGDRQKAIEISKTALANGTPGEGSEDNITPNAMKILQLISENLSLWDPSYNKYDLDPDQDVEIEGA